MAVANDQCWHQQELAKLRKRQRRIAHLGTFIGQEAGLARSLRFAVIQQQYDLGHLTTKQARDLLCSPLTPGDDTTFVDDSGLLIVENSIGLQDT